MDADTTLGTPTQRLEVSRRAIARQLARRRGLQDDVPEDEFFEDAAEPPAGFLPRMRRAARIWWRHHPVHSAVDFARPALEDYAHHKPLQLLGIAAGVGASLALLKSWRVLSLTGIGVAMLKSSDLTGAVRSMIVSSPSNIPHES